MAEETIIDQDMPETIEPENADKIANPNEGLAKSKTIEPEDVDEKANPNEGLAKYETIETEDVDEKANPNERLTITKGPPKILSRYLSGPKGSCHDLCKYGIQHAVEAKPWSRPNKWVAKRERKTKVPDENVTSLAVTKKPGSSSKPSLTSKIVKPNCPVDIKEVTDEKTATSEKNSPPFEETDVSMEHYSRNLSQASEPSSLPVQECSKSQTKRGIAKHKSPLGSCSRKETESRSKQARTSSTGGKEKSLPPSIPLPSKNNVKKPSSSSAKTAKNLTGVSSLKNHENVEEAKPELASNDTSPDKILHIIEPTSANLSEETTVACDATKLSSPSPSSSRDKSLKKTNKKTGKSVVSASSRKGLRHAGNNGKSVALSHLSSGNTGKTNMQHKVRSASPSSSISPSNSSIGKKNGATSKSNNKGQGENVKVGYKIRPKRSAIVGVANKAIPAWKLTFRRGKVIEIQPQSNNVPRRLKFKSARLLGNDIRRDINGTRNRIIKSKEVDDGELNAANIKSEKVFVPNLQIVEGSKRRNVGRKVGGDRSKIDGSKSIPDEKVVLRHQNVEGKKQNPRLYNNVIEETASMLAELRKSKVKALVGAFETVISLDSPREATPSEVSTPC
ncbi:uncharacterized protein LOC133292262 [Gastrolobium bilobum]|uniref:uncharacterized protein LOC133292262 n=1 Tax=Gastrolobium bilobum TaxID=150636 RepID=UPI002AAF17B7|nr:uncharacterized protein LOC133292262 [Gastrolobium bilobum]